MCSSLSWFAASLMFTHEQHCFTTLFQGVSGTGKTTLGSALAKALDVPYVEGDDLHPRSNIEKMSSGDPLTDSDREPWLKLIRTTAEMMTLEAQSGVKINNGGNKRAVVISCSALKKRYRDILRGLGRQENNVKLSTSENSNSQLPILKTLFVYIEGTRDVLMDRMMKRTDHFMKPSMLDSQLQTLEDPVHEEGVIVISLMVSREDQVQVAQQGLRRMLGMEVAVDPLIALQMGNDNEARKQNYV
jgi:gluconokinase